MMWTLQSNTLLTAPVLPPLPSGELTFNCIKSAYPYLFKGLGEMDEPFSLTLNPDIRPLQAAPHCYVHLKPLIIKEVLDNLVDTTVNSGQQTHTLDLKYGRL